VSRRKLSTALLNSDAGQQSNGWLGSALTETLGSLNGISRTAMPRRILRLP
jgi:hypothetical protein